MSIANLKTSIATALTSNLTNTVVYKRIPEILDQWPCVVIQVGPGNNLLNMPHTKQERTLYLDLVLTKAGIIEDIQDQLDTYILPTGTNSMVAAIKQTVCGTDADWLRVNGDSGPIGLKFGDVQYIGCRWTVIAMI